MSVSRYKNLDSIDRKICRIEKTLASLFFLFMSAVILADVIHRVFSRSPGRVASILAPLFQTQAEALDPIISWLVIPSVIFLISYGAIDSRSKEQKTQKKSSEIFKKALLSTFSVGILITGFIKLIPSGLVWSPYFGLCCLLWLGLLGASIATHQGQHLALEMGEKIWPVSIRPIISKIASLLVGVFCLFIALLAVLSVIDHYRDWSSGPGAGLIPSVEWPKWMVYLVVPYSFMMMGVRFIFRSFGLLSDAQPQNQEGIDSK